MPSVIHKYPIAEELRETLPKSCQDLMLGSGESHAGLLWGIYRLIGESAGCIELAYRRGFEEGVESTKDD